MPASVRPISSILWLAPRPHDSGLCVADAATRWRFAADLDSLTLASPSVNRNHKKAYDAAEWMPAKNQCWFAGRDPASFRLDETDQLFSGLASGIVHHLSLLMLANDSAIFGRGFLLAILLPPFRTSFLGIPLIGCFVFADEQGVITRWDMNPFSLRNIIVTITPPSPFGISQCRRLPLTLLELQPEDCCVDKLTTAHAIALGSTGLMNDTRLPPTSYRVGL